MKLEKFKEKNKKQKAIYIGICISILLLTVVIVIRSFALYEEKKEFDVIKGQVPDQNYDVMFSFFLTDKEGNKKSIENIPEGKDYEVSLECNNGATGIWDYENWGPLITNLKNMRTKCKVNFVSKYRDSLLNGTDPVLSEGLIPVKISENGVVTKANVGESWYNYSNKEWANAVILSDETKLYQNGEVIPEDNIESYFVWIPRYRYKIFNDGSYEELTNVEEKVQTIEIEFETKDTTPSTGSNVGEWLTHPAFTSFESNGMWVGKFETGYKEATTTIEAEQNIVDVNQVQIKPNVYSWRNIQIANAHLNSYNYKREFDSHMMKNTEWGAVAYLSHSVYGLQAKVRINNNGSYITGYAARNEPTCGHTVTNESCNIQENTSLGVDGENTYNYLNNLSDLASTTGNKTGIYDMSGGSWEYVMGVMLDQSGTPASGRNDKSNSNFIGTLTYPKDGNDPSKTSWTEADGGIAYPESKYYDTYAFSTSQINYNRRILGDATGEMGPFDNVTYGTQTRQIGSWYKDEAWFVQFADPWFRRGGAYSYGIGSGVFSFIHSYLVGDGYGVSFRIVLAV